MAILESLDETLNMFFSARYIAATSLVLLVYDHLLTLDQEILAVWSDRQRVLHKVTFILNRYYAEAVMAYVTYVLSGNATTLDDAACQRFVWVFAIAATVFITATQFCIILRVYHLWDKRRRLTSLLVAAFVILIVTATGLTITTVIKLRPYIVYVPFVASCSFSIIPKELSYLFGILLLFDLLLIALVVYHALESPHRSNAEVINALHQDGARLFLVLCALRVLNLIMTIKGNPADCFAVLSLVWSLNSIIVSRIHLRVEGLRFMNGVGFGRSFMVV